MNIKSLTRYFIGIGIVSIFIALYLLGVNFTFSKIFTVGSILFITWLMLPYIVWAFLNERRPDSFCRYPRLYIGFAIAMPIIGFGMVGYASLNSDPQAGFFIFYIPFIQFISLGIVWGLCKK
jgi:hypothetical protein